MQVFRVTSSGYRFGRHAEPDVYLIVHGTALWLLGPRAEDCARALAEAGQSARWSGPISGWLLNADRIVDVLDWVQDHDLLAVTGNQFQASA